MQLIRDVRERAKRHRLGDLAAQVAFWSLLSLPALLLTTLGGAGALSKVLSSTAAQEIRDRIISGLQAGISGDTLEQAIDIVDAFMFGPTGAVIGIGIVVALWSGARATGAFFDAASRAYETPPELSKFRLKIRAFLYTIIFTLIAILILALVVVGPIIGGFLGRTVGADELGRQLFSLAWWPIAFVTIILAVALSYRVASPRGPILPGAAFASVGWLAAIVGVRIYAALIVEGSSTYGPLAAPVVALLVVYVSSAVLLLGAEVNATIAKQNEPSTRAQETIHAPHERLEP